MEMAYSFYKAVYLQLLVGKQQTLVANIILNVTGRKKKKTWQLGNYSRSIWLDNI